MRAIMSFRCVTALSVAASVLGTISAGVHAEEIEVSGRNVQHITRYEPTELSEGHVLATFEAVGITIAPDDEVTTNRMWGQLDHVDGLGPARGYTERTWADGSTTLERWASEVKLDDQGNPFFEGSFRYTEGTGRFEGMTGEGTFRGRPYDNGMLVADWEATIELPSQ